MIVGKAIYYLLNASNDLEAVVGTRIFPEVAEQDSALPFVMYSIISNEPSDTHSGPSLLDIAQVDVIAYNTSYSGCIDMGVYIRAALDRVTGTYNGVNVQSCQYNSEVIDFDEYKRAYVITQSYDVRISRTEFEIAQGTPVTGALLGDLYDVTITSPLERDALVYDSEAGEWINGIPTDIPVINKTSLTFTAGTPLRADGVQGDRVKVNVYRPNADPKLFIGLASDDIAPDATGYVRQIGIVHHLDTDDFEIGDILYPQQTLFLGMQALGTTPPSAPNHAIAAAIVLRKQQNTGRVFVRTWTPAYDLNDISDVDAASPTDGQALTWSTNKWVAGNIVPRQLGDLSDVYDYGDGSGLTDGTLMVWSTASDSWILQPRTSFLPGASAYYLGQYDTEAGNARIAASTASVTVERYLTIQGDGEGESITAQSDTPSSGNVIRRKIWYKANSFEQSDVDTWTLVHTFADDTAYSATEATFEALLNAQTYGTPPFTLAQSWEDVPAFTGLLDTYPGAAAAYSLRLLDADYSGSAINVRRASDNAVQDIGFDANGDLDTSALATFCAGTDGFVVRRYDQTGGGDDAVQASTSLQDKIYDASSGVLLDNGKPYTLPQGFGGYAAPSLAGAATTHVFEVINAHLSPSASLDSASGAGKYPYLAWNGSTGGLGRGSAFYVNGSSQSWVTRNDAWQAINGAQKSINYKLSTSDYVGFAFRYGLNNTVYSPKWQEQIVYNSDQSANRAGIETNINDYYTIY